MWPIYLMKIIQIHTLFLIKRSFPKFHKPFLSLGELTLRNSISLRIRDSNGIVHTVFGTFPKCFLYWPKLSTLDMNSSRSFKLVWELDLTWSQVFFRRMTLLWLNPVTKAYKVLKLKSCLSCLAISMRRSIFTARCRGFSSRRISDVTQAEMLFQWWIQLSRCWVRRWYFGSSEGDKI